MKLIQTAIIGGAGYTAGELIRILLHHPQPKSILSRAKVMQVNQYQ